MKFFTKLLVLLLTLCLTFSAAYAESLSESNESEVSLGTFTLPDSATLSTLPELPGEAPEGLAEMYSLMSSADSDSICYLIRAENGLALVSIATFPAYASVDEILSISSDLEQRLLNEGARNTQIVKGELFGLECVRITAEFVCGAYTCSAEGLLIPCDDSIFESWKIYPQSGQNLPKEQLSSDIAQVDSVWDSLSFISTDLCSPFDTQNAMPEFKTQLYTNLEGAYSFTLPEGSSCLYHGADADTVKAARESYHEASPSGTEALIKDVFAYADTDDFFFLPGGYLLDIGWSESEYELTPQQISDTFDDYVLKELQSKFDSALLVSRCQTLCCGGITFEISSYFFRSGEANYSLDVLCSIQDGYWVEMDLYVPVSSSQEEAGKFRMNLLYLLENGTAFSFKK